MGSYAIIFRRPGVLRRNAIFAPGPHDRSPPRRRTLLRVPRHLRRSSLPSPPATLSPRRTSLTRWTAAVTLGRRAIPAAGTKYTAIMRRSRPASIPLPTRLRVDFARDKIAAIVSLRDHIASKTYQLHPRFLTNLSANREKRRLVTFSEIPNSLVNAITSVEDKNASSTTGASGTRSPCEGRLSISGTIASSRAPPR